MEKIHLEIGCDGGSIKIISQDLNGVLTYKLHSFEIFASSNSNTITFLSLDDAWLYLKHRYKKWYQLYLIQISTQMTELVKPDYILAKDKNEHTIKGWLEQLTGRGIGF